YLSNFHLQYICITTTISIQGLLVARNYPAPRFAMVVMLLMFVPLSIGGALTTGYWMIVIMLAAPLWIHGSNLATKRLQRLLIDALIAKLHSQQQAQRDPLTGAHNRLSLTIILEKMSSVDIFAIFCIDLDGFKKVNDTLGHGAGDRLLQMVTTRISRVIRETDTLARTGGDEFIVIAPGVLPASAAVLAEKLIASITQEPYEIGSGSNPHIGASIGISCGPQEGAPINDLLGQADHALYDAKKAGKGIWRHYVATETVPLSL
ncbi:MAG: GGDEF domain-containing protein, partial [Acidocella sp.]|nr:GGDEF domain-containing protein [Acidocella sp.]